MAIGKILPANLFRQTAPGHLIVGRETCLAKKPVPAGIRARRHCKNLAGVRFNRRCHQLVRGQQPLTVADQRGPELNLTNPGHPSVRLELDPANAVLTGQFLPGTDTQEVNFDKPITGRYFVWKRCGARHAESDE